MSKTIVTWVVVALILMVVFQNIQKKQFQPLLSYSEFVGLVNDGQVDAIKVDGLTIKGNLKDKSFFETVRPQIADNNLINDLLRNDVLIQGVPQKARSIWVELLLSFLPMVLIIGLFMFFIRQMQSSMGGKSGPMSFGKSKAKMLTDDVKIKFDDVAGCDEAKGDMQELVEYLCDPSKFRGLGGKIPSGVLMVGPPGTGKTLLAKAVAGEASVPFFTISGSDFVEMFVGVGASRVRDMFEQAKKHSPCIIFIDEIDAVGRHRGAGLGGGHDEREQTLNQLLVEMDGFGDNDNVIVIAATNRPHVLDAALLRPGRFDRQIVVGLPDIKGREAILKVHMKQVPLENDVVSLDIARGTPGFSGADLSNLVNEAALFAARSSDRKVSMYHFEQAKDKIMMGAERKSMIMSEKEKSNTAYHEAGHAIVGRLMPEHDPVYKVSIIPRGRALGVTMFLPEEDRHSLNLRQILSQISALFGGRIAEEMILGFEGVTTGASNDIERATEIARNTVTKWGLSSEMGPILYDNSNDGGYAGGPSESGGSIFSNDTAVKIDNEVRRIIDECYQDAEKVLKENIDKLHAMADALMKYETIDREQINNIMLGCDSGEPKSWNDSDKTKDQRKDDDTIDAEMGSPANQF
jgi:cell division protease FtsH